MKRVIYVIAIFITATYAVRNDNCPNLWNRWRQCLRSPPPLAGGTRRCFIDGNQLFFLSSASINGLSLFCQGEQPDSELTNCLNVTTLYAVLMQNCKYSNFILEDYIGNKNIVFIYIINDVISGWLLSTDMVISNIPLLRNIIIFGDRSKGLFNVTFENLPSLILLNITNHNFTRFHNQPFRHLYSLEVLSLRLGIIEVIPQDLFYGLENLRFLDLASNHIKNFHNKTFEQLTLLLDLNLEGNYIEQLPSHLFSDLKSLATLKIQNNKMTSLPTDLFRYIPNLMLLDITGNIIDENIPDGFLNGATRLQSFLAMNCSLTALHETLFSDTRYLALLALSLNRLKTLPPGLFNTTENLLYLFLDDNEIHYLQPRTFHSLFRLLTLRITYNKLNSLDRNCFNGLSSLSHLYMSDNRIVNIENSTFDPLVNLQYLDISNNPLVSLPFQFPFGQSKYLSTVVVSKCHLREMPNVNWIVGNLTFVDFSYNIISDLTLPIFTKNRTQVLLFGNNVSFITLDFANVSAISPIYYIKDNPLRCDCNLQDFLQFLHSDIQKRNLVFVDVYGLKCFESNTKPLMDVWPPYKACPLESKDCPPKCLCYVTIQQKVVIECYDKELITAPNIMPPETAMVYLQNNNLTKFSPNNANSWRNIEELFLSNNSLESLEEWHIPPKLKLLAIDGNLLTSLPSELMARIESITDFQIYLANNSWQCDCQSISFKRWFDKNEYKILDSNYTLCTRQIQENGTKLLSLIIDTPIDLFCLEEMTRPAWQIAIITIAVLVLLLIFSAVGYYRYQNTILSLLYSRNVYCFWWDRKDCDDDKIFDAFLCYNSADRDVIMVMMKDLEPSYKLCIHERDWLPGYAISHHIVNSVQNSRKTLLLVSKNFLESIWFQVEFRTAYSQMLEDRIHRLVLIIVGDIGDISNLEDDLRHLLSTKTYLKWGEKWFWEKLRYALRRSGKQTVQ